MTEQHDLNKGVSSWLSSDGEGGGSSVPAPSFSDLAGSSKAMPPAAHPPTPAPAGAVKDPDAAAGAPAGQGQGPLRVLVVGGSMAGSCAALALGRLGCQVQVFERSYELKSQGAGGTVSIRLVMLLEVVRGRSGAGISGASLCLVCMALPVTQPGLIVPLLHGPGI